MIERLANYRLSRNTLYLGVSAIMFPVDLFICGALSFTLNKGRPCLWQWRFLPPTTISDLFSNVVVYYPFHKLVCNVYFSLCQKHEHFIDAVAYWTALSVTDLRKIEL